MEATQGQPLAFTQVRTGFTHTHTGEDRQIHTHKSKSTTGFHKPHTEKAGWMLCVRFVSGERLGFQGLPRLV